jgi:hypothetical protein
MNVSSGHVIVVFSFVLFTVEWSGPRRVVYLSMWPTFLKG